MDQPGVRPRLEIRTPVFEGPLELLLALAEREEVDILQVSLSELTAAYVREVTEVTRPEPREMAEFLWLGSRLLLLKSVRLLPGIAGEEEETDLLGWEEDVRRRLDEYRTYKQMAEELMRRAQDESYAFPAPARVIEVAGQEEPLEITALLTAFQSVLERIPPRPLVFQGRNWTPAEKIAVLEARLEAGPLDLVELLLESEDRLEAVVTFVALLELLRRGRVRVRQTASFGAIRVEPLALTV
ncbi:MAG TPA: segregation/condensation protein A [Candidatus Dormibacteraeota bacterium]